MNDEKLLQRLQNIRDQLMSEPPTNAFLLDQMIDLIDVLSDTIMEIPTNDNRKNE